MLRWRAVGVVLVFMALSGLSSALAVGASWTLSLMPHSTESLSAISCSASNACTTVGTSAELLSAAPGVAGYRSVGTEWSPTTLSRPTGGTSIRLPGLSCPSSLSCTGIGSYVEASGTTRPWETSGTTPPSPSGATSTSLAAVSCRESSCNAVGTYVERGGVTLTLAEVRAEGWRIQSTPNPSGGVLNQLFGISCVRERAELVSFPCIAVGSYIERGGSTAVLVERLRHDLLAGDSWELVTAATPVGARGAEFAAVSCTEENGCTAVGSYVESSGVRLPLAERWNGRAWEVQATPRPSEAIASRFTSVSCSEASSCLSAGKVERRTNSVTLAEAWNGREWSIQRSANPGTQNEFSSIVCVTASDCKAAGTTTKEGVTVGLIERLNAGSWEVSFHVLPRDDPRAISCATSSACMAVGYALNVGARTANTYTARYDGRAWRLEPLFPLGEAERAVTDISCPTTTFCMAIGYRNSIPLSTWVRTWNGSSWRTQTIVRPGGTSDMGWGVSCISATDCTIVGTYSEGAGIQLFYAEHWNSSEWRLQTIATRPPAEGSNIRGMDCVSTTFCVAAASYAGGGFIEMWDGASWRVQAEGTVAGSFEDVDCISEAACFAVGGREGRAYGARWNGREWAVETGWSGNTLEAISCVSEGQCEVGSGTNAFQWNGSEWAGQTRVEGLRDISCVTAVECVSIGIFSVTGIERFGSQQEVAGLYR